MLCLIETYWFYIYKVLKSQLMDVSKNCEPINVAMSEEKHFEFYQ